MEVTGQGVSSGLAGFTSEAAAAAAAQAVPPQVGPGLPVGPSPTALMSEPDQQQPASGTGPVVCKQEHGGASGSAALGPPSQIGHAPGVVPGDAPDTSDPEAVAAALGARMNVVGASIIFEKPLTASDVSGGGRVVVPKSVAEQYFPRLEQPSGVTISATDLDGRTYTFKWRFWVNNSSRMYLLEGAGELHKNYGLEVGDVMVFAQKPDGSLVVAGRVASKADLKKKAPAKRPVPAATFSGAAQGSRSREGRMARAAPRPLPSPSGADAAALHSGNVAAGVSPGGVAATAADGGAARARKRKLSAPVPSPADSRLRSRGDEGASLAVLDMEAPSDGIFRALVMQHAAPVPLGVVLARNNRWTATLEVAGEVYQAFFDTRDDAVEAVIAAGASP
ncbi:hypothetical protein PLESTB_000981700 [Pleodorina starrii]|uniref:TF-B3 domain-containing protein n=1 Tax=Pleodorina starrii TaxID=330485 RepID=A0A9W6BP89_9CHLO|nr:hypothetical protein PLESTM_000544800 [Pleodorina starrii]GLC55385.1 hypothetical protein PLESTB_000981700 [Pleodorina starrii]GLC73781.1 hypothetical protein PLESTF_001420500 [Pleodorina starrii]